jgi:hypothetical protein
MRKLLLSLAIAAAAMFLSPESLLRLESPASEAQAKARVGGGMQVRGGGRSMGGAKSRPSYGRPSRPSAGARPSRPSAGARPSRPEMGTRPARPDAGWRPGGPGAGNRPGKPERPGAGNRPGRPGAGNRPGRPELPGEGPRPGRPGAGERPIRPDRPGAGHRPGRPDRPGWGNRPGRPPNWRPGNRPPGWRPPHYRPPYWRPPHWRPPYYRPPYYRPPSSIWGPYYWYPRWGWYFTTAVAGATLAYVVNLPDDDPCEKVRVDGEDLFICDGVLYRPVMHSDQRVYEIVSSSEDDPAPPADSGELRLTSPLMRGSAVHEVQVALAYYGYDVGTIDGVFGRGTDRALREFQRDNGLPDSGVVDDDTAVALGL